MVYSPSRLYEKDARYSMLGLWLRRWKAVKDGGRWLAVDFSAREKGGGNRAARVDLSVRGAV